MENMEKQFKKIAERYCSVKAEDITNDMNLRNDLENHILRQCAHLRPILDVRS